MAGESQQMPKTEADPSVLTTEALQREVDALKDMIDMKISGLRDVIDEKFESVDTQFTLIERQRVEQKNDTKQAVDAALQAAKEAVKEQTTASDRAIEKSETSTTGKISSVEKTVDDLKERVGKIENLKLGGNDARAALYAAAAFLVALIIIGGFVAAAWPR